MRTISQQATDLIFNEIIKTWPGGSGIFLNPDPSRVALIMQSAAGGVIYVSPVKADAANNIGLALNAALNPIQLTFKDVGSYISGAWLADSTALNATLYAVEILYRPASSPAAEVEEVAVRNGA